jgi:hypothetical protein
MWNVLRESILTQTENCISVCHLHNTKEFKLAWGNYSGSNLVLYLVFFHQTEFTEQWKREWRCSSNVTARIYFSRRENPSGTARNAKTWRRTEVYMILFLCCRNKEIILNLLSGLVNVQVHQDCISVVVGISAIGYWQIFQSLLWSLHDNAWTVL